MANPTSAFGWQMPTSTDLVTDLPADFETFGQAVDTSLADLKGGTSGQILSKASNTDMDFTWVTSAGDIEGITAGTGISGGGTSGTVTITNSMATTITTSGDLIYGTGSGTFTRQGIGSTGQILTVTGGVPTWETPASSGSLTLLSTSTFSGTSFVVSSINQSYTNLFVNIYGLTNSGANSALQFIPISGDYNCTAVAAYRSDNTNTSYGVSGNDAISILGDAGFLSSGANNNVTMLLSNYSSAIKNKSISWTGSCRNTANNRQNAISGGGSILSTTAISSLTFNLGGNTFTGGTIQIYGVK